MYIFYLKKVAIFIQFWDLFVCFMEALKPLKENWDK